MPSRNIDHSKKKPLITISDDNFSNNIPTWERHLLPHLGKKRAATTTAEKRKHDTATVLIIGANEGLSSIWLAQNAFGHEVYANPQQREHHKKDVSTAPSPRIWALAYGTETSFRLLKKNVKPFGKLIKPVKINSLYDSLINHASSLSSDLRDVPERGFDAVYIDVGHASRSNLEAAMLSFPLLRPGGMMLFNNYTHDHLHTHKCPRPGIDAFVSNYSDVLKVVFRGWQLVLIKRRHPLPLDRCMSEYYHEDIDKI